MTLWCCTINVVPLIHLDGVCFFPHLTARKIPVVWFRDGKTNIWCFSKFTRISSAALINRRSSPRKTKQTGDTLEKVREAREKDENTRKRDYSEPCGVERRRDAKWRVRGCWEREWEKERKREQEGERARAYGTTTEAMPETRTEKIVVNFK